MVGAVEFVVQFAWLVSAVFVMPTVVNAVEIRDAQNECVWDRNRYPKQTHCRNCGDPGPVDHCTDEFPEPGDIRETGR